FFAQQGSGVLDASKGAWVHAIWYEMTAGGGRAETYGPLAKVLAGGGDGAGRPETPTGHARDQATLLGKEDIRPVQADDQRQSSQAGNERPNRPIGHHPMDV